MADALFMNATGGAPAYNAQELRAGLATLMQWGGGTRMISAQPGVRPGGDQCKVTLSGSNILMEAGCAIADPGVNATSGPYLCQFLAQVTVGTLAAAHATLVRVDIVYLRVRDSDEDGSGSWDCLPVYLQGTPGSGQPATPPGGLLLASINVPQSGGGSATVTDARTFSPAGPVQIAYTSNGTFVKANYPWARMARVRVQGGGGGGGGAGTTVAGQAACGSGGGGGGYAEEMIPLASMAASETVTVGAAGAAATAGANNGGAGGNSSFGTFLTGNGGSFGQGMVSQATAIVGGGTGGGGVNGTVNVGGQNGQTGRVVTGIPVEPGCGGHSMMGFGGQSPASSGSGSGRAGQGFGAGGSGGLNRDTAGTTNQPSGPGTAGVVIVELW